MGPLCSFHDARHVKYAQFLVAIFVLVFGLNVYTWNGMSCLYTASIEG